MIDFTKLKVVELRKELVSRGLPQSGDKSELIARLQAAVRDEDSADITLDSDEIDSDAVLDEDESQSEVTYEAIKSGDEELALADPPPLVQLLSTEEPKPRRVLKRKNTDPSEAKIENKDKKIVLNRSASITSNSTVIPEKTELTETNKIKITVDSDPKSKLEMRAKRFGISAKMTETERKEARKLRFGQGTPISGNTQAVLSENLEKLKKRAERFGESVSRAMIDLETKEKLEKRKDRFGVAN